jgi:uncharacterized membrane protein
MLTVGHVTLPSSSSGFHVEKQMTRILYFYILKLTWRAGRGEDRKMLNQVLLNFVTTSSFMVILVKFCMYLIYLSII